MKVDEHLSHKVNLNVCFEHFQTRFVLFVMNLIKVTFPFLSSSIFSPRFESRSLSSTICSSSSEILSHDPLWESRFFSHESLPGSGFLQRRYLELSCISKPISQCSSLTKETNNVT